MALVVLGTAVTVAAALGALAARDLYSRLHFVTPVSSLGAPLVAIGLSVNEGANLTTASILLPAFLLFMTGPVLSAAIARTAAQREGRVRGRGPE